MSKIPTDIELVHQFQSSGAEKAFNTLFNRYQKTVFNQCMALVKVEDTAEDLCQEIFMKVHQRLGAFNQQSSFTTWLHTITYNHCIDYLRKHQRIHFEAWLPELDLPDTVEPEEWEAFEALKHEQIHLILEILNPTDKAVLLMRYKDGLSMEQIQTVLKLDSLSASKMKLNRAKKRALGLFQTHFTKWSEE